jgi:O-glycosyl hydrolase
LRRSLLALATTLAVLVLVVTGPSIGQPGGSPEASLPWPAVEVIQTDPSHNEYLARLPSLSFSAAAATSPSAPVISVDDTRRFQTLWGVGAAITNSAAWVLTRANAQTQRMILDRTFAPPPEGAHYGFVRLPIGGSDFNAGGIRYSEDDMPPGATDPGLAHFNLSHDKHMIRVLQVALRLNPGLRIIASPWSAPGWMKTNDSLDDVGFRGRLLPEYRGAYANYFVKFVEGYRRAGIPVYAITVQNEPINVPASYEGMNVPPGEAGSFIRLYLRPALRAAGLHTRVFGPDESYQQAPYARTEGQAAGGLDGIAWHCYTGNPDTTMPSFRPMTQVVSECSNTLIRSPGSEIMIDAFNGGASAGALWNLALYPDGTPVIEPDTGCPGCHGVINIDPSGHPVTFSNDFYGLGQVGELIEAGARRIAATRLGHFVLKRGNRFAAGLDDVAFHNPGGGDVLVVYNNAEYAEPFRVKWRKWHLDYTLSAGATVSFEWWP